VRASVSLREDGLDTPSSTALRWALLDDRTTLGLDLDSDPGLLSGASVRGLSLRWVLAAAVPAYPQGAAALVVDSRRPPLSGVEASEILGAYAAIVGILASPLLKPEERRPRSSPDDPAPVLVGRSPAFQALERSISRVAATRLPVLVVGESGAGKESVARGVHDRSPRRSGPMLAINCSAFPESLLESELFGAARGAYTGADRDRPGIFQLAHGGTLFLDEVADMPVPMQAKLLRVLQDGRVRPVGGSVERSVDVRIVAATNRDLADLVARGRFRADLYYRLAVVQLRVPPLRERAEDFPALVDHLLSVLARDGGLGEARLVPAAMERLLRHPWPGNVRELESVLARALLRVEDGEITPLHLDFAPGAEADASRGPGTETRMIETALRKYAGNLTRAAAEIGWSRQKLRRRMLSLGVARPA
jgi:DNA-binding NtrC family response regulator